MTISTNLTMPKNTPNSINVSLQLASSEQKTQVQTTRTHPATDSAWWRQAVYYVLCGLDICRRDILGLLTLVALFVLPPLAAVIIGSQPGPLAYWVSWSLPWITITLGNIAAVLAIEALAAGRPIVPGQILPACVRWLPRYLWTNGITTVLFWGLFLPLQWLVGQVTNRWGWSPLAPTAVLLIPMLFWHVRLVFATYAAIVDDQPGLRAVMISLKLPHRRWKMIVAAFAGSFVIAAPLAAPIYFWILTQHNPLVAEGFEWALVMPLRPLFIATLHVIYHEFRPTSILASTSLTGSQTHITGSEKE